VNASDHLDAALARLKLPDDLEHLPPVRLRRLRDSAYTLQKMCDQILAQRVGQPEPKAVPAPEVERTIDAAKEACEPVGILARLAKGHRSE
jgi:hypothetical protein